MRWKNLRASENTERRRGGGRGAAAKGGLGALIMAVIAIFVFKQDPGAVLQSLVVSQGTQQHADKGDTSEVDEFVQRIQGSTEDVWTELFRQRGERYKLPKLINYDHRTPMKTGGVADARMGPFYLPAEETIYIDTAFFDQMDRELGGGGDFAYAYVIAHEVGHHVQKLKGMTDRVHRARGTIPDAAYNRLSVRLKLQADFYAGVWAHHANKDAIANDGQPLLEEGDIEEAMRSAKAIGDDTLQRNAGREVDPETFNHGTSEQRMRWFLKGLKTGDPDEGDTFNTPYDHL